MNPTKAVCATCLALAILAAALGVAPAAAGPLEMQNRSLAATCAGCHGTDGRPSAPSPVPPIAGIDGARLRDEMIGFKRGTRDGTVMPQIAKGFSDAQIDRLATYFAARRRSAP